MPAASDLGTAISGIADHDPISWSLALELSLLRLERAALQAQGLGWRFHLHREELGLVPLDGNSPLNGLEEEYVNLAREPLTEPVP